MLSVIVPVFNKEKYISRCVETIIGQSFRDIEVIIVDDGSKDESGNICDRLADGDNRIHVIHKQNEGLIMARQTGIKKAQGEYVTFVDADDWVDLDMYSELMKRISVEDADFITSGMIYEDIKRTVVVDGLPEGKYTIADNSIFERILWSFENGRCGIMPSLGNKIFKKEVIWDSLSNVDCRITLGEDRAILYPALIKAKDFIVTGASYYHYRITTDSMCHDPTMMNFSQLKLLVDYEKSIFEKNGIYDSIKYSLEQNLKEVINVAIANVYGIVNQNYLFPFKEVPKNCKLIIYGLGAVGKSYCKSAIASQYVDIVAIADKYSQLTSFYGISVIRPEELKDYSYDFLIMANASESEADTIRTSLIDMGVEQSKIKWISPVIV